MRSKEGLVLPSCDPVDSSSSLSLQRSSLVIEIASNHYPEYAAPSDKIPSLRPVSPTRAARTPSQIPLLYRILWPFPHVESSQSVCRLRDSDERVKTLLTPRGVLFASTVIVSQAINSVELMTSLLARQGTRQSDGFRTRLAGRILCSEEATSAAPSRRDTFENTTRRYRQRP